MEERKTKLLDLPNECLSLILSLTSSPYFLLRCSLVCKVFYCTANSDFVWKTFVSSDLLPIVEPSSSTFPSTKELVLCLCRSFIFLEDDHMGFSLEKWTGKKHFMLGARRLNFASGDMLDCWRWKPPQPKSRFLEVAELLKVDELHITGRISAELLSPNTTYRVYFSFKLEASSCGFDVNPVKVFLSRIHKNGAYVGGIKYEESKTYYLKAPANGHMDDEDDSECGIVRRWIKIDMGKYFNRDDNDVAILEMTIMGTETTLRKSGLIVHAIELLPVST